MSKEKQIEEMAKVILRANDNYDTCNKDDCEVIASLVYDAGYRKQSEGEWIKQRDGTHYCSNCGHDATYNYCSHEICGVACTFCGAMMKGGAE